MGFWMTFGLFVALPITAVQFGAMAFEEYRDWRRNRNREPR